MFGSGLIGRKEADGTKKFYLKDHLGSTRQVLDDTGTLLEYGACPERGRRNIRNLPLSMSLDNGLQATYRYNSAGWRIHKRVEDSGVPSVDEHYIMDGGTLLAVTDANGTVKHWNLFGNGLIGRKEADGAKKYYIKDHLGSTRQVLNSSGTLLEYYDYYPFGLVMRSSADHFTKETFTGKEQDPATGYYYFGARYYDAALAGWGATDPARQFASPYVYAGNPVSYVDPDGEFLIEAILIGAAINTIIQGASGNINNFGDFALAAGIGGLSGAAGYGAGQLVSGVLGVSSTLGGSILNGALTGAAGGFSGGFVSGAGNAWAGGSSFSQGLGSGLQTGGYGALTGGVIGGISGGIQYGKRMAVLRNGNAELGIKSGDAVPATDEFLSRAQEAWYPDAPIDRVRNFTVENVPAEIQKNLVANHAAAQTTFITDANNLLTGYSNVYFNSNLAFSSAKQLYFSMGHEFVHVSHFSTLAGVTSKEAYQLVGLSEFHAYSYQNYLGDTFMSRYPPSTVRGLMNQYPNYFKSLNWMNYKWTWTASF